MNADLILFNGQFHTVDREKPHASAVAISDGRFVVVGTDAQAMALRGPSTQVIDLKGRCVIPGLNDHELESVIEAASWKIVSRRARMSSCVAKGASIIHMSGDSQKAATVWVLRCSPSTCAKATGIL